MFTDGPLTPIQLETLISVLRYLAKRKTSRVSIIDALQPPSVADKQEQAKLALRAAKELKLVEDDDNEIQLSKSGKTRGDVRDCVLAALDKHVLGTTDNEYYFALFYSYMLGLNMPSPSWNRDEWVTIFKRDVFNNQLQENPFNTTKLTGLHRWFSYTGLGWYDSHGRFHCNPYPRLARNLPGIFGKSKRLDDDAFMKQLATHCPELDGGEIFRQANPRAVEEKRCTLGLAHALIELHNDELIQLHCSRDSKGWSVDRGSPPVDRNSNVQSPRIDFVELLKGA